MTFTTACAWLQDILCTDSSSARATCSGVSPPPSAENAAQPPVDAVEIRIEIEHPRHVGVADVAVGDQAHAQVRRRLPLGDEAGEAPDLLLRALDEARHRAGRVEREHQLDARPGGQRGRRLHERIGRLGRARRRQDRGPGGWDEGRGAGAPLWRWTLSTPSSVSRAPPMIA